MKQALSRIINKDIKQIEELKKLDIHVNFNEDNILKANAVIIGPDDTVYEGSILYFNIVFPNNYPFNPPTITYKPNNQIRIHPNIYVNGRVCLSLLGTWSGPKWTSIMDISSILISIKSLLNNNPLHNEPGFEGNYTKLNTNYNDIIRYNSIESLYLKNTQKIPYEFQHFKDVINDNYNKKKEKILSIVNKYKDEKLKKIVISFYRIDAELNYKRLWDEINQN